jgi:hypothetical protein
MDEAASKRLFEELFQLYVASEEGASLTSVPSMDVRLMPAKSPGRS